MVFVALGESKVLPAIPPVLAVIHAARVIDPVSLEAVDDVVHVGQPGVGECVDGHRPTSARGAHDEDRIGSAELSLAVATKSGLGSPVHPGGRPGMVGPSGSNLGNTGGML